MTAELKSITLDELNAHPNNPRLTPRDDVIDQIRAQLDGGFPAEHAILVRPLGTEGSYQIVSGHQRVEAARRAGLAEIPCWVREMDDEDAFMELVLSNAQGELAPLEVGIHALRAVPIEQGKAGGGLAAYADKIGRDKTVVSKLRDAAGVYELVATLQQVLEVIGRVKQFRRHRWHRRRDHYRSPVPSRIPGLIRRTGRQPIH